MSDFIKTVKKFRFLFKGVIIGATVITALVVMMTQIKVLTIFDTVQSQLEEDADNYDEDDYDDDHYAYDEY